LAFWGIRQNLIAVCHPDWGRAIPIVLTDAELARFDLPSRGFQDYNDGGLCRTFGDYQRGGRLIRLMREDDGTVTALELSNPETRPGCVASADALRGFLQRFGARLMVYWRQKQPTHPKVIARHRRNPPKQPRWELDHGRLTLEIDWKSAANSTGNETPQCADPVVR
jgi:hypothetical protein